MTVPFKAPKAKHAEPFVLPPLAYEENALEPVISARTISFHYGKHHKAYVDKLNELVRDTEYGEMELEEVIRDALRGKDKESAQIFNNAAQVWNHTFYWSSLTHKPCRPKGDLAQSINRDFGDYERFKAAFAEAAISQLGSGWAWLVLDNGKLKIEKTPDADTPMAEKKTCLLNVDVWEHAYYLDYQNRRADYVKAVIDNLLNWDFAVGNFVGN